MGTTSPAGLWTLTESDLQGMTPQKARDLLVECFYKAQGETFRRSAASLNMQQTEAQVRETVTSAVRLKFKRLGVDWDCPTADCIGKVADDLAHESKAWGTADGIIEHHMQQMQRVRTRLS